MASILIVEDEPISAEVAAIICRAAGHLVDFAENGQQALERLAESAFDLVLLDVLMPVMDGITFAQRQRALYGAGAVPILAVTARCGARDRAELAEVGIRSVLAKPYRSRAMLAAIDELLGLAPQRATA